VQYLFILLLLLLLVYSSYVLTINIRGLGYESIVISKYTTNLSILGLWKMNNFYSLHIINRISQHTFSLRRALAMTDNRLMLFCF